MQVDKEYCPLHTVNDILVARTTEGPKSIDSWILEEIMGNRRSPMVSPSEVRCGSNRN